MQKAKVDGRLSPEVVAAYAALHIVDDDGLPIIPAHHHWLWLKLLCDENIRQLLIIAPPESAKTTWVITSYVGCFVGFYPESNVIIASSSGGTAKTRSISLRATIESAAWRATFPGVVHARRLSWEMMEWSLAPEGDPKPGRLHPTVSAYGTGGSIEGSRADLLIGDDILNEENTRTAYQREVVKHWAHTAFFTRSKSGRGRKIIVGTAKTHDDLYAELRSSDGWVVCHTPLLSPTDEVYATLSYPNDWPYPMLGEAAQTDMLETLIDMENVGASSA